MARRELDDAVLAVAGVHQVGRLKLELGFQVFPVGVARQHEGAVRHGKAHADFFACHDGGQVVIGVVGQAAAVHHGARKDFQPGGFLRPAQLTAVHGKGDVDGILVEFRRLQVDAHAVGKGKLRDSQVRGFFSGRYLAGFSELVGECLLLVHPVGFHLGGLGFR